MHTSPDRDARLLPWIDATGPLLQAIIGRHDVINNHDGTYTHVFTPLLPGGGTVDTPGGLPGAERRERANRSPAADEQQGYDRLMACLMHSDKEKCECCQDDQS